MRSARRRKGTLLKMKHGMLTTENIDLFAQKLKDMLTGKSYVFVACHEGFGWTPEINVDERLQSIEVVRCDTRDCIVVCESRDTKFIYTGADTDFSFDHQHDPMALTVTHKSGSGHTMKWAWKVRE